MASESLFSLEKGGALVIDFHKPQVRVNKVALQCYMAPATKQYGAKHRSRKFAWAGKVKATVYCGS